ncbi:BTB/POZ domain-containing protein [Hirsutella rhossiliensis]|uniref:BTB/POZ domain-containing protein n=1 Tax=Hirsutella rhossiliensis TaxID=111463 RepID=A0A9P8MYS0_9HYPO|nr:BTB/POZ domain-containing protein [Hirsutella rhossiliensis]KAH0962756.1 BTB/POZ domain-containing protein [Hirsutella rhossiliensis]
MAAENLTPALTRMMLSGDFSDLKFTCKGKDFKVHKAIVCAQSPVIKAAVQGGFEESHKYVINMDKFHTETVKQLVKFMYSGDYDASEHLHEAPMPDGAADRASETDSTVTNASPNGKNPDSFAQFEPSLPTAATAASLIHHVHVNCIGDYYAIDALVSLADSKIKRIIDLQGKDKTWVSSLPTMTQEALEWTGDNELLEILASATAENISALVGTYEFKSLKPITDFSLKVLRYCDEKIRGLGEELQQTKLQVQSLESRLAIEASAYQVMTMEKSAEKSAFDRCLQTLRKTRRCRNVNCDSVFGCYIDPEERVLRCQGCKCKHKD